MGRFARPRKGLQAGRRIFAVNDAFSARRLRCAALDGLAVGGPASPARRIGERSVHDGRDFGAGEPPAASATAP